MLRGTHEDGGITALNISLFVLVLLLKFSKFDYLTQVLIFILCYPAMRFCATLCAKLPDADLDLEVVPVKNEIGYLFSAIARKNNAQHREPPLHCIEVYSRIFTPLLLILLIVYFTTNISYLLMIFAITLSCYLGFMSHLILDGYTLKGVYITKTYKKTFCKISNDTTSFHLKWLFCIPLVYKRKVNIDVTEKKTGGTYEFIIRNNVNQLNMAIMKLMLVTLALDIQLFMKLIKDILLT